MRSTSPTRAGTPSLYRSLPPALHVALHLEGVVVGEGGDLLRHVADEQRAQRQLHQRHPVRVLDAVEEAAPLLGRVRGEHAAGAGRHRRDRAQGQLATHHVHLAAGAAQHGDVVGAQRLRAICAVDGHICGEQVDDPGGHVGGDCLAGVVDVVVAVLLGLDVDVAEAADLQRRGDAVDAGVLMVGCRLHRVIGDEVVAEGGSGEQHIERIDERAVAAPVGAQRPQRVGTAEGGEV